MAIYDSLSTIIKDLGLWLRIMKNGLFVVVHWLLCVSLDHQWLYYCTLKNAVHFFLSLCREHLATVNLIKLRFHFAPKRV